MTTFKLTSKIRQVGLMLAVATGAAILNVDAHAGTLFYGGIPAQDSDANSGLKANANYTSAIVGGAARNSNQVVNGVSFTPLIGSGQTCSAGNVTLSAASGTLNNGGGKTASIQVDGTLSHVFSAMIFNDGAADDSEQYIVLDPASLKAGKTYDLRVYFCNASGQNRLVNLSFAGDGQAAVETDFFNEDDATTSAGGFSDPNQVYYIDYRFSWDGATTPGITITQRYGQTPFCLYALTNEEVAAAEIAAAPPRAVEAASPKPSLRGTRALETDTVATEVAAGPDVGVSSEVFYSSDSLRSHGRWISVGSYGRCWQPEIAADWRPYTRGRWVHSPDAGWIWDSDEQWGWATYHYGRWSQAEGVGWFWVPGRVWAPSWVSWRYGRSYVGWAPLPPEAIYSSDSGIGTWSDHSYDVGPSAYNFCGVRDFGAPSLASVIVSREENLNIITKTTNVTNIVNNNTTIYSGGPNVAAVNSIIVSAGKPAIPLVQLDRRQSAAPLTSDGKFSALHGNVLSVAAPRVAPTAQPSVVPKVAATIAASKIDHGWNQVKDPKVATELKAKIALESQGRNPKNAPAQLPRALSTPSAKTGTASSGGRLGPQPGSAIAKPGQPLTAPKESVQQPPGGTLKPDQPLAAPGKSTPAHAIPKPGQPLTVPKETASQPAGPPKPGQSLTSSPETVPTPARTVGKPGQPSASPKGSAALPTAAPSKPGQPLTPPKELAPAPVATPEPKKSKQSETEKNHPLNPATPLPEAPVKARALATPSPAVEKPNRPTPPPAPKVVKPAKPSAPPATVEKPNRPALPPAPKVEKPAKPSAPPASTVEKPSRPAPPPAPKVEKPAKPSAPPASTVEKPNKPAPPPAPKVEKPAKPSAPPAAAQTGKPAEQKGKSDKGKATPAPK